MTNVQLYLTIGIPSFLVLLNLVMNFSAIKDVRSEIKDVRSEIKDVRSEMQAGFSEVKGRLSIIEADLRQFYSITGKHDGRLDALERKPS